MVNIKQLIQDKGISQKELSKLLNEYESVISLIVNGRKELTTEHLEKLERIFGLDEIKKYEGLSVDDIAGMQIRIGLKELKADFNLTQLDLADIMGEKQSVISTLENGKRRLNKKHIDKLVEHFGEDVINKYTLPTEAYKPQTQAAEVTILTPEVVEEMKEEVREEIEAEEIKKTIVLTPSVIRDPDINIKKEVKAGNLDEYAKPTQDILPLHQGKVYTYCDDMEPEIRAGEPVLVRLLPSGIPVVPGEMYFVDMPSGGKIRYVEKEEDGKLHLKARNNVYGDIIIDRKEVQSLWSVVLILRTPRSMSTREATAQEMLVNKDRHLDRLLDQMDKGGERERMLIEHLMRDK